MLLQRIQPPFRAAITSITRTGASANTQKCLNEAFAQLHISPSSVKVASPLNRQVLVRYASHKSQGAVNGSKSRPGKRLGCKKTGGQYVIPGNIIFRQRGTHWFPGENCAKGRDHTIYATQPGYVRYYQDPEKHPKRQYIGVALKRDQMLPTPRNAKRRRRLGMVTQRMKPENKSGSRRLVTVGGGEGGSGGGEVHPPPYVIEGIDTQIRESVTRVTMKGRKGEGGRRTLTLRPGYMFRESNWEIGRAAERAKVKVTLFKPRDRWTAWQKRTQRIKKNAEQRSMSKLLRKKKK